MSCTASVVPAAKNRSTSTLGQPHEHRLAATNSKVTSASRHQRPVPQQRGCVTTFRTQAMECQVLAWLSDKPGTDVLDPLLPGVMMFSVNWSETAQELAHRGSEPGKPAVRVATRALFESSRTCAASVSARHGSRYSGFSRMVSPFRTRLAVNSGAGSIGVETSTSAPLGSVSSSCRWP